MTIEVPVPDTDQGVRIDRFIKNHTGITQSAICKMMRRHKILVNDIAIQQPGYRLEPNTSVLIKEAPVETLDHDITTQAPQDRRKNKNFAPKAIISAIKKSYIYEDENLIVINKPHGLATQSGGSLRYSVDDMMRRLHGNDIKIVHRLDKETSGLLLLAKNRWYAAHISKAFQEQAVGKIYLAVVSPIPKEESGIVHTYNHKISGKMNRYRATESRTNQSDKIAITKYKVLKQDAVSQIALVQFEPQTGRTHQIRLHALQLGCPIVGDYRYDGNLSLSDKLQLLAYQITVPNVHRKKGDQRAMEQDITFTCPHVPSFFLLDM